MAHDQFNASDADVTIKSADGVLFHLHRKNLETNTGAFPGAEFNTGGEQVVLTEPAKVLVIVFQFIYPRKHPKLKDLDFETVAEVAEAVEKYEVFSAMNTCEVRLREFLPDHAARVFGHAVKHDYPELIDETAVLLELTRSPSLEILKEMPSHCRLPWIEYRNAWHSIFEDAICHVREQKFYSAYCFDGGINGKYLCSNCRPCLIAWVVELERINSFSSLKEAIKNPVLTPDICHSRCNTCKGNNCQSLPEIIHILQAGIESLLPFTHFLKPKDTLLPSVP